MNFVERDKTLDRPRTTNNACGITTPKASWVIGLLGSGIIHEGTALTKTETDSVNKLYGFTKELPNERPAKPKKPDLKGLDYFAKNAAEQAYEGELKAWEAWKDPIHFHQAGANRNVMRHVSHDGVRLVAWIAKFCDPGQDPMKVLIQMAIDAGFDVDPEDVDFSEYAGDDFDEGDDSRDDEEDAAESPSV